MAEPLDPHDISARLRAALDEADAFVARMLTDKMGLLFVQDGKVVQPDPAHLEAYATHVGQRRGRGPPAPTSPLPCSNITRSRQVLHKPSGNNRTKLLTQADG